MNIVELAMLAACGIYVGIYALRWFVVIVTVASLAAERGYRRALAAVTADETQREET